MKRSGLTPHLASATLFLVLAANVLPAQESLAPSGSNSASAQRLADLMKRLDKDGDGKLDDKERAEAKELLMHEKIDLQTSHVPNGEGPMSAGGPEGFRQKMIEMFDRNKDGRLDEEERAAAEKFAAERGVAGRGEMRDEVMKRFDKNGNGRLDPEEREAAQTYIRERMEKAQAAQAMANPATTEPAALEKVLRSAIEKNDAQLRRFDADKNGKLDDKEWTSARREIQRWASDESTPSSSVKSSAEPEQKRLTAVADEVASRREAREKAMKREKK